MLKGTSRILYLVYPIFFCFILFFSLSAQENPAAPETAPQPKPNGPPKKKGLLIKDDDPPEMKRWAVVVGVNDYNDAGITDLSKAQNDAKIIGQILSEQGEFERVFVMTDDLDAKDTLYPTRINIEEKLDNVLGFAGKDDLILFFFSGHGISDSEGNAFVLPVDTVMEKALYTAVPVNLLIEKIRRKGISKSLLILDACRDVMQSSKGSSKEGLQADKFTNAEVGATFFSTKSGYYSFEDPKSEFGVFTKYMAYGLEGKADANGDGIVSFKELEEYVQSGVMDWSLANNKQQKPFVKYFRENYGDIPITVKGVREKSLVEENDYRRNDSKFPIVWRSALVPGWGQYYAGSKMRGGIAFGTNLLFLAHYYSAYSRLNSAQSLYNRTYALPGDAFVPTFFNLQAKQNSLEAAEKTAKNAYILLLGVWCWNLIDAGLFTKMERPKEKLSFDLRREYQSGQNIWETYARLQINFEF